MNFLAHLYWSEPTPGAMAGSLMPDLVRGRLPVDLPADVLRGVVQHRRLDALTDSSPIWHEPRLLLRERHGRLAGILLDVFLDHVLAVEWSRHHGQPLAEFVSGAYGQLALARALMPPPMPQIVATMTREDWLGGYASIDGMRRTLTRMSSRLEQRVGLAIAVEPALGDLIRHQPMLADALGRFFQGLRLLPEPLHHGDGHLSDCPSAPLGH
jgi:acyl carrier protein phosphodiesterase